MSSPRHRQRYRLPRSWCSLPRSRRTSKISIMVIEVAKVRKGREPERAQAPRSGPDAQRLLELQYIADALDCIRGELVGIPHLIGIRGSADQTLRLRRDPRTMTRAPMGAAMGNPVNSLTGRASEGARRAARTGAVCKQSSTGFRSPRYRSGADSQALRRPTPLFVSADDGGPDRHHRATDGISRSHRHLLSIAKLRSRGGTSGRRTSRQPGSTKASLPMPCRILSRSLGSRHPMDEGGLHSQR